MYKNFIQSLMASGLVSALLFGSIPPAWVYADSEATEPVVDRFEDMVWESQKGDWILANVGENTLRFVRAPAEGQDLAEAEKSPKIRIGSGINNGKKVNYLGMTYNPATPERTWEIRSKHQQNVYWIFGSKQAKEQLFLRLYEIKGDERIYTRYGIHTTPEIGAIIEKNNGFGSYGCLITRYDLLKKIEELFALNEGVVRVKTVRG